MHGPRLGEDPRNGCLWRPSILWSQERKCSVSVKEPVSVSNFITTGKNNSMFEEPQVAQERKIF